jgi:hypothetical protein
MPSGMRGMAAEDPPETEIAPREGAEPFHGLKGVLGAGWQKTAVPAEQGGKRHLVPLDQQPQDVFHLIGRRP